MYDTTVGDLVKALQKYPKDASIVIHADRAGTFASFYPLNNDHGSFNLVVRDGSYQNTVYIGVED